MAVDLKFSKFDSTPWGFRLTGGSDYNLPLTVVKVYQGSLAEAMGLREGDVLVALNDQKVGWVTHDSAHDHITKAGNNFFITVLRGNYDTAVLQKYASPEARVESVTPPFIQDINSSPITNGFVNKVSPISPYQEPPPSIIKPIAKSYKPFCKDLSNIVPPYERPLILSPLHTDEFQTIKQREWKDVSKIVKPTPKLATCGTTPKSLVKDDLIVNGGLLLDLHEIEKSAKEAAEEKRERIIKVMNESNEEMVREAEMKQKTQQSTFEETRKKETREEENRKENIKVTTEPRREVLRESKTEETKEESKFEEVVKEDVEVKSVKKIIEEINRATTPSPSIYKMSCRIRNPSVTPVIIENVAVDKFELVEEIVTVKNEGPKEPVIVKRSETPKKEVAERTSPIVISKEVKELSTSEVSLEEAKSQYISAASKLSQEAKQRNYKVPCVAASIPTQTQTDVLLKTFFIHLTDVMVALTHMITTNNTCCHCAYIQSQQHFVKKEVVCGEMCAEMAKLIRECTETIKKSQVSTSNTKTESSKTTVERQSKETKEKQVQTSLEKPPEKSIVTISETAEAGRVLKEVFQSDFGVDVTVNGKDPLEWLADLDKQQSEQVCVKKTVGVCQSAEKKEAMVSEERSTMKKEAIVSEEISKIKQEVSDERSMEKREAMISEEIVTAKQEATISEEKMMTVKEARIEEQVKDTVTSEKVEEAFAAQVITKKEEMVSEVKEESLKIEDQSSSELVAKEEESSVVEGYGTSDAFEVVCKLRKEEDVQVSESLNIQQSSLEMSESIYEEESLSCTEEIVTEPEKKKKKRKKMMKVIAKDPQTPNTEEYLFKLDVKLEGKQQKEEQTIHEDFSIVRKPGSIEVRTITKPVEEREKIISDPLTVTETKKHSHLKLDLKKEEENFPSQRELDVQIKAAQKPSDVFVLVCQPSPVDTPDADQSVVQQTFKLSKAKGYSAAGKSESISIESARSETTASSVSAEITANLAQADEGATQVFKLPTNKIATNIEVPLPASSDATNGTGKTPLSASLASLTQETLELSENANKTALLQNKEMQQSVVTNGYSKTTGFAEAETTCESQKLSTKSASHTAEVTESSSVRIEESKIEHTQQTAEYTKQQTEAIQEMRTVEETKESSRAARETKTEETHSATGFKLQAEGYQKTEQSTDEANISERVEELKSIIDGKEAVTDEPAATVWLKQATKGFASVQPSRVSDGDAASGVPNGLQNGTNGTETGEYEDELGKPGLTDEEIAEIISGESEVLKDQHVLGVNFAKMMPVAGFLKDSEVFKALNEESIKSRADLLEEQRKYTKFLQKPNRPIPFCRRLAPTLEFTEPPYKVNIKHQPKTESGSSILTEGVFLIPEVPILVPEPPPELLIAPEYLGDSEFPDLEDTGIPIPERAPESQASLHEGACAEETVKDTTEDEYTADVAEQEGEELSEEMKPIAEKEWKDLVDETIDESLPVEQQLVKVQKQLEALSKLPAAIQQTLDLVSKQLGKMVPRSDTPRAEEPQTDETVEDHTQDDEAPTEHTENGIEPETEEDKEDGEDRAPVENGESEEHAEEVTEEDVHDQDTAKTVERPKVQEPQVSMSEEAKIQKMKQDLMDELSSEQSRQAKQRPSPPKPLNPQPRRTPGPKPVFGPLTPNTRPLVLPGGRKWKTPKDAFTDAFIAETMSSQATVIQGKALGSQFESAHLPYDDRVDFMKYKKPPVVLDHIKESSVYKLVHEMDEAPPLPIEARPSRVMSEAEYRERCRSVTPNAMQMSNGA